MEPPGKSKEEAHPQKEPLKETGDPIADKALQKQPDRDEKTVAEGEEPGTFDRVFEHGRQMGF